MDKNTLKLFIKSMQNISQEKYNDMKTDKEIKEKELEKKKRIQHRYQLRIDLIKKSKILNKPSDSQDMLISNMLSHWHSKSNIIYERFLKEQEEQ